MDGIEDLLRALSDTSEPHRQTDSLFCPPGNVLLYKRVTHGIP